MPRKDINQTAFGVAQQATGEAVPKTKRAASVRGGLRGGKARNAALTSDQRADLARLAASVRWKKKT